MKPYQILILSASDLTNYSVSNIGTRGHIVMHLDSSVAIVLTIVSLRRKGEEVKRCDPINYSFNK